MPAAPDEEDSESKALSCASTARNRSCTPRHHITLG